MMRTSSKRRVCRRRRGGEDREDCVDNYDNYDYVHLRPSFRRAALVGVDGDRAVLRMKEGPHAGLMLKAPLASLVQARATEAPEISTRRAYQYFVCRDVTCARVFAFDVNRAKMNVARGEKRAAVVPLSQQQVSRLATPAYGQQHMSPFIYGPPGAVLTPSLPHYRMVARLPGERACCYFQGFFGETVEDALTQLVSHMRATRLLCPAWDRGIVL